MDITSVFGLNLGSIPLLSNALTRSCNPENPTGAAGGGAQADVEATANEPHHPQSEQTSSRHPASLLGKGWKVRPCITLDPGTTTTLADITGPGIIQHIWITVDPKAFRSCVLRMYWDNEPMPSVEVPLGDLFANAHGIKYNVTSLPVAVNPSGGLNSYWPMPFRQHALITIESDYWEPIQGFFYQITYALDNVPQQAAYFHAQWRRATTTRERPEHIILDGIRGQGQYVGTMLGWAQYSRGWWGEGEVKFYIDDDGEYPTICGTGTEDYFGGAWGFGGETYSTAFLGYPLYRREPGETPKHGLYRWHIMDPIRFKSALRVTIQALGWWLNGKFEPLTDDIASVGLWYQAEPHAPFPQMPDLAGRWPR